MKLAINSAGILNNSTKKVPSADVIAINTPSPSASLVSNSLMLLPNATRTVTTPAAIATGTARGASNAVTPEDNAVNAPPKRDTAAFNGVVRSDGASNPAIIPSATTFSPINFPRPSIVGSLEKSNMSCQKFVKVSFKKLKTGSMILL